jgi:hypothetical protein
MLAGSYEHGNEPLSSIKDGKFLVAERLLPSQEGLFFVEVGWFYSLLATLRLMLLL